MFRRKQLRKHRELEDKYDHYVCERCMDIGAKEVISEFVKDIDYMMSSSSTWNSKQREIRKKWEEKLKCRI